MIGSGQPADAARLNSGVGPHKSQLVQQPGSRVTASPLALRTVCSALVVIRIPFASAGRRSYVVAPGNRGWRHTVVDVPGFGLLRPDWLGFGCMRRLPPLLSLPGTHHAFCAAQQIVQADAASWLLGFVQGHAMIGSGQPAVAARLNSGVRAHRGCDAMGNINKTTKFFAAMLVLGGAFGVAIGIWLAVQALSQS
jgi:hypothetical protein